MEQKNRLPKVEEIMERTLFLIEKHPNRRLLLMYDAELLISWVKQIKRKPTEEEFEELSKSAMILYKSK